MGTAACILLAQSVFAAESEAVPSQNSFLVHTGSETVKLEAVPAYLYEGNNYFMLRDIGKTAGYAVVWNGEEKTISLNKDDSAMDFAGLSEPGTAAAIAKTEQTIFVDGVEYKDTVCLNIDGYNYFKLRDLAEIMDFDCGWDSETKTVSMTLGKTSAEEKEELPAEEENEPKQQNIEEKVVYAAGSHDYGQIESYFRKNIDEDFKAEDYIITETNLNVPTSAAVALNMRLDINGIPANIGYYVVCVGGMAEEVTWIGEKNPDFDITKAGTPQIGEEEAKQMALEADGTDYEVEEQSVRYYFDMEELAYKCQVETVYKGKDGDTFATEHIF